MRKAARLRIGRFTPFKKNMSWTPTTTVAGHWSKVKFSHLFFKIKVADSGVTESKLFEYEWAVSTVSDDLGDYVICLCWSTVFYQQRRYPPENADMPLSADRFYGDASSPFPAELDQKYQYFVQ